MNIVYVVCLKLHFRYNVYVCENRQRQSCKAFIVLSTRAKLVGGGVPFYAKFWRMLTRPLQDDIRKGY